MDANQNYIDSLFKSVLHRAPRENELQHWSVMLSRGLDPRELPAKLAASDEFSRLAKRAKSLFVPPGHFYSPIVDVDDVRERFGKVQPNVPPAAIKIDGEAMKKTWSDLLPYLCETPFPEDVDPAWRYHFKNPAFGYGDGSILHAMLRCHQPRRIVEIGSGYSSACTIETIDRYFDNPVEVSFVEPFPELLIKLLGEEKSRHYTIHASPVQKTDLSVFTQLQAGDFLFIDSTHVMKTGSDVCHELFNILPAIQPGVFVHFHDIFWPFEYGPNWVIRENRSWNEIYGLRAFLMYNDVFEIVFFNDYFARNCRDLIEANYPTMLKNTGGSIWLRKRHEGG
jgi:hypothetical protein